MSFWRRQGGKHRTAVKLLTFIKKFFIDTNMLSDDVVAGQFENFIHRWVAALISTIYPSAIPKRIQFAVRLGTA